MSSMKSGPIRVTWTDSNYSLLFSGPGAVQLAILIEAAQKYTERNVNYRDNWVRMGWRGMLVRVRERSERLWDGLWSHPSPHTSLAESERAELERKLDDAIDLINFAAFLVRAVRENNRDGSWWEGI